MRIAIDVNGVLRDTIGKVKQVYEKNLIDVSDLSVKQYESSDGDNWEESEEEDTFKYEIKTPITSLNLQEFFKFKDDSEYYSFLYEEYTMEIFGHAGSTETLTFNYLNDFYYNNRDVHEIIIVSDEIGKSKPATLFFLSKFGCLVEKIKFFSFSTINSMWDEIDILLTSNPDLLLSYPDNKKVIKYNTEYNKFIICDKKIDSLSELNELIKKIE
jgi:hypothetical protein